MRRLLIIAKRHPSARDHTGAVSHEFFGTWPSFFLQEIADGSRNGCLMHAPVEEYFILREHHLCKVVKSSSLILQIISESHDTIGDVRNAAHDGPSRVLIKQRGPHRNLLRPETRLTAAASASNEMPWALVSQNTLLRDMTGSADILPCDQKRSAKWRNIPYSTTCNAWVWDVRWITTILVPMAPAWKSENAMQRRPTTPLGLLHDRDLYVYYSKSSSIRRRANTRGSRIATLCVYSSIEGHGMQEDVTSSA